MDRPADSRVVSLLRQVAGAPAVQRGPRLDAITSAAELARLNPAATGTKFSRVYETVQRLRQDLPRETALIGFCGAPWTVATYMVGGEGSSDQAAARQLAYRDPETFAALIDTVTAASIDYLDGQVRAGADALQIFDSWAGNLPDGEFDTWVVAPTRRIVAELKRRHPGTPIIGFPRGAGANAARYVKTTKVEGLGCDTAMPLREMRGLSDRANVTVQGNLDPLLLAAGGPQLDARVRGINVPGGPVFAFLMRLNLGFSAPKQPIGGFEMAGEVEAVGSKVTRFKPGDRVVGSHGFRFGLHQEYATFGPGDVLAHIPDGVSDADAVAVLDHGREHDRAQHHAQRVESELGDLAQGGLDDGEVAAPDEGHSEQQGVETGEPEAHGREDRHRPGRRSRVNPR